MRTRAYRAISASWLAVLLVTGSLPSGLSAQSAAVKIMPLGDSITRGSNYNGAVPGGYRRELGVRLANGGFSYDFVGNRSDNAASGMDPHHNGLDGFRTDQTLSNLSNWLQAAPDIVLMHLGTNDLIQKVPVNTVVANLNTLIERITQNAPNRSLFVATVIPIAQARNGLTIAQWASVIDQYNTAVRNRVQFYASQGRNVRLVDMHATLVYNSPNPASRFFQPGDGTHPGQAGYNQMGVVWYNALVASGVLTGNPNPDPPPPASPNLALNKPASASSIYGASFSAVAANDGNSGTIWSALSNDTAATWTVDLGSAFRIERVEIVARQNLDQPLTRQNFEIRGSNDPTFATFSVLAAQGATPFPHASTFSATVTTETPFRHIRVAKTDGTYFAFAEARVFGDPGTPPPPPPTDPPVTLTVASSPASGVNITASPADINNAGGGTTGFSRQYPTGTTVTLSAPASSGTSVFFKWLKNGADHSSNRETSILMDAGHTMTAVYSPGTQLLVNGSFESDYVGWTREGNQEIRSAAPYTATDGTRLVGFNGANTAPNGVLSQGFATTPGTTYSLRFDAGVYAFNTNPQRLKVEVEGSSSLLSQTVTINGTGGGAVRWFPQSFSFVANSSMTTLTFRDQSTTSNSLDLLLDHVRVIGPGTGEPPPPVPNTAPVAMPDSFAATADSTLVVSPPGVLGNDSDPQLDNLRAVLKSEPAHGSLNLASDGGFSYTPTPGFTGEDSFTYCANDGSLDSQPVVVTLLVRTSVPVALVNGSFESGLDGWTSTGSLSIKSAAPYSATNGSQLVAFNSANLAPNGTLTQTFNTTAGQTYSVSFDLGVLSFNTNLQKMQVTVTGSGTLLLSESVSIRGPGGGNTRWAPQLFSFVANGGSVTLGFRDQSSSTNSIDLLLDNVRVDGPPSATLPGTEGDQPGAGDGEGVPPLVSPSMEGIPGSMVIRFSAPAAGSYVLERSLNLHAWEVVETMVTEGPGIIEFQEPPADENPSAPSAKRMFFRIGQLPAAN